MRTRGAKTDERVVHHLDGDPSNHQPVNLRLVDMKSNAGLYLRRDKILADPAISRWLKEAIRALDARDPVDAAKDADLLAALFDGKCKVLLGLPARHATEEEWAWT